MWIKNSMGRNNSSAGLPAGLIGRCCSCFLFLATTIIIITTTTMPTPTLTPTPTPLLLPPFFPKY